MVLLPLCKAKTDFRLPKKFLILFFSYSQCTLNVKENPGIKIILIIIKNHNFFLISTI